MANGALAALSPADIAKMTSTTEISDFWLDLEKNSILDLVKDVKPITATYTFQRKVVSTFSNPAFPLATVTVQLIGKEYGIFVDGRCRRTDKSQAVADINAEELHKSLVEALINDKRKDMPNFGMF